MNNSTCPATDRLTSGEWELPEYRVDPIRPKRHRYCVSVFVINEGHRIQAQLRKMREYSKIVDIVIADGGSTDGSLALDVLQENEVCTLLTKTGSGALSAQMRMAFAHALSHGYAGVITMDGNNKDDPAALPRFVEALEDGYDHVQGSRFVAGGQAINTPFVRLAAIRLIHAPLISWASGEHQTDTTNGFRGYSRRLLMDQRVAPFRSVFVKYELHYYLAIRAARLGLRTTEIPVVREYPSKGPIPTKLSPWKGNWLILQTLWQACRGRYDPPTQDD